MDMELVTKEEKNYSDQPVVFRAENKTAHQCVCGRTVCCGKHKNGGCACHQKGRERD